MFSCVFDCIDQVLELGIIVHWDFVGCFVGCGQYSAASICFGRMGLGGSIFLVHNV